MRRRARPRPAADPHGRGNRRAARLVAVLLLRLLLVLLGAGAAGAAPDDAAEKNKDGGEVPYVPTPSPVVERMLELAGVGRGDYVIDLGSGDGRIVIAAAERGAFGHGVEIDPERNAEAREKARRAGVSERVVFLRRDFFESDVRPASVVTLYLFQEVNEKLRPKLLEELRPGTRIVSHAFDMGAWEPDKAARVSTGEESEPGRTPPVPGRKKASATEEGSGPKLLGKPQILGDVDVTGSLDWPPPRDPSLVLTLHDVYLWVVPADASGHWQWEVEGRPFRAEVEQRFQELELSVRSGERASVEVDEVELRGRRIHFLASVDGRRYAYSGRIDGDAIAGTVQVREGDEDEGTVRTWSARRAPAEPTGP